MAREGLPAARFDDAMLADLFCRAYEGYFVPVHLDAASFRGMMDQFDVSFDASRVLLENGDPLAIAMLGLRDDAGWIGGMGVVSAARGRGLGARAMEEVLGEARRRHVRRVDLEVLVQNAWAIRVYQRLGFGITRRLGVLERLAGPAPAGGAAPWPRATTLPADRCLAHHDPLHAFERLPWQRGLRVQRRAAGALEAIGVEDEAGPVAAVLVRPGPGKTGILDVGLASRAPSGALEAALGEMVHLHHDTTLALLNLESGHPAEPVLRALGFEERHAQHEMALSL
jgi:GNAT superfamily N-acetyltransferase